MDDLDKFIWWVRQHPYLAGALGFWVACTLFGRWQPSRALVERYPRLLAAVLIARDVGLAVSRIGQPIAAFFAPSAARQLVRAVYPDPPVAPPPAVAPHDQGGS